MLSTPFLSPYSSRRFFLPPYFPCVCVCVILREWAVDSGLFLGSPSHGLGPGLIPVIGSGGFCGGWWDRIKPSGTQWARSMAGRWTKSERAVISHCVPPSFGVCVIPPEHILHPRALFSNQWPPLPGSRDTPLQDFISVSDHNWVVSSLEKNNAGQDVAAQSLFKALSKTAVQSLISHYFNLFIADVSP